MATRHALRLWALGLFLASFLALCPNRAVLAGPGVLPGSVPPVVAQGRARFLSAHPTGAIISIAISLQVRNPALLDSVVQSVSNPTSANYHRYLTQDQANQEFNPTVDQEQQVIGWVRSHGLTVTQTYANHLIVDAQGTTSQIDQMFGITVNDYSATIHGQNREFFAPQNDPTIDASVSSMVSSVTGLNDVPRFHLNSNGTAHNGTPYYPQDFANAYDLNALWAAGAIGTGQHIGITMWTVPPSDTTLQTFAAKTGASVATQANGRLKVIPVDGGTTSSASPDDGEAGMDIESSSDMAPGAVIDYYEAPTDSTGNPTDNGLVDALNLAATDSNKNLTITNSWGGCEASSANDAWTRSVETVFATAAATGHDFLFSSGDNGSWCDPNSDGTGIDPFADYPADSAYVTSVGGTKFSGTITGSYPGEAAWKYCSTCDSGDPEGSGGGYSSIFARPVWQVASGLTANGKRAYPDISAVGDPQTGMYVCWGNSSSCGQVGGTSLSSPLWAGILADLNQYVTMQGRPALGFINPTLYTLAATPQTYQPFHDVTSGTNGQFNATSGWDAVTGWGTPDVWNMARDLAGAAPCSPPIGPFPATVSIQAQAGWNMVGGAPLTLWSDATIVWAFNATTGQWYRPTSLAPSGTGTWEYVSAPGARTVTTSPSCTSSLTLPTTAHRFNLVGNPCAVAEALPSTALAFWYDPTKQTYVRATTINPGAAVWVKSDSASLVLSPAC